MSYRFWYRKLLLLYPKPYRERFGDQMVQMFGDLYRERKRENRNLFTFIIWVFFETAKGIIKENITFMIMQNTKRRLTLLTVVVAALLLIPFLAKWPWSSSDFVAAAVMLLGSGVAYEFISRRAQNTAYKLGVAGAVGTALFIFWSSGAVGIIGSEDNPANIMYLGVIAVEILGAIISRLRAPGMAKTMFVTAIAHALVPVIALVIWKPELDSGVAQVIWINAFFVILWVASGLLFKQAADIEPKRT
jgi:hypothetical protein